MNIQPLMCNKYSAKQTRLYVIQLFCFRCTRIPLPTQSSLRISKVNKAIFLYLGFLLQTFMNHRTEGEGGRHFFNSSLPLPPASQKLRHQPGNYCRELTFAHSYQPDSRLKPLVSQHKSLTTKLCSLSNKAVCLYH